MQCNMHLTASHLLWPLFRDSPPSVTRQNARRGLSAAASNLGGSALQWRPSATGLGALSRACPLPTTFAADGAPLQQAHRFGLSVRLSTPRVAPEGTGGYARSIQLQLPALGASLNGTSGQGTHSPPGSSRDRFTRPVSASSTSATFAALGFSAGSDGRLASPS